MARELRSAHSRLRALCGVVVNAYGPNNQAAFTFLKVTDSLERLCDDLRAQAAHDYPGMSVENLYR